LLEIFDVWKKEGLLKQSVSIIGKMIDETGSMFELASNEFEGTATKAGKEKVYLKDEKVNRMQREVRRKVLEHLSFSPAQDITASLISLYVVNDLERIGDYCKNLEDIAVMKKDMIFRNFSYSERLEEMQDEIAMQFPRIKKAFTDNDLGEARLVTGDYSGIKDSLDNIIEGMMKDKRLSAGEGIAGALYARHLKRINAHLKNIASCVSNPFDRIGYKPKDRP
jgi:phosphate uptake regulator